MRCYMGGRTRSWLHLRSQQGRARFSLIVWEQDNGTHTITVRAGLRGVGQVGRTWHPSAQGWLMHNWTW